MTSPFQKGTRSLRLGIWVFSILLTFLFIWLLGFILSDISRMKGPQLSDFEKRYVNESLSNRQQELHQELRRVEIQITNHRQVQEVIQTGLANAQQTLNQLIELQKKNLEKDIRPTAEEQAIFQETQARFLKNQEDFQRTNEKIAELVNHQQQLQAELQNIEKQIEEQRRPAQKEYEHRLRRHQLLLASIKLVVLLPLLFLSIWLLIKKRKSKYIPVYYAFCVATFWRTAQVIHEHFPNQIFKYIAILAGIAGVLTILVYLIRLVTQPRKDLVLKEYREAYNNYVCPKCYYPIQLASVHVAGGRYKGGVEQKEGKHVTGVVDTPYTCPSCGQRLYDTCSECGKIRHTLLLYCQHCGSEIQVV